MRKLNSWRKATTVEAGCCWHYWKGVIIQYSFRLHFGDNFNDDFRDEKKNLVNHHPGLPAPPRAWPSTWSCSTRAPPPWRPRSCPADGSPSPEPCRSPKVHDIDIDQWSLIVIDYWSISISVISDHNHLPCRCRRGRGQSWRTSFCRQRRSRVPAISRSRWSSRCSASRTRWSAGSSRPWSPRGWGCWTTCSPLSPGAQFNKKNWLEFRLEKSLEFWLEIPYSKKMLKNW